MIFFGKRIEDSGGVSSLQKTEKDPKSEEEIITAILENCQAWKELLEKDFKLSVKRQILLDFKYGSKKIELDLIPGNKFLSAVTDISRSGLKKIENDTTLVYCAVKTVLEEIANKANEPILYTLKTKSEKILAWANSEEKGKKVFGWGEPMYDEKSGLYYFEKTFYPPAADG